MKTHVVLDLGSAGLGSLHVSGLAHDHSFLRFHGTQKEEGRAHESVNAAALYALHTQAGTHKHRTPRTPARSLGSPVKLTATRRQRTYKPGAERLRNLPNTLTRQEPLCRRSEPTAGALGGVLHTTALPSSTAARHSYPWFSTLEPHIEPCAASAAGTAPACASKQQAAAPAHTLSRTGPRPHACSGDADLVGRVQRTHVPQTGP